MNRKNAKKIRVFLKKELPSILDKYGMTFELGNATFDSDSIKFNGFRLSINGALSQQEKALKSELDFRKDYGVGELDQTKIARLDGMKVSLIGFKPRARKHPFIVQDLDTSKEYVIAEDTAERIFGVDAPHYVGTVGSLTETDRNGKPINP